MILESSLDDLYKSTIKAFPNTTRRQHATETIKIASLQWIPFLGMNTLFVKGLAQNEGREYEPIVVFKKVIYHEGEGPRIVTLQANDGKTYFLERLSLEGTDVLVRCGCGDFHWRMNYWDHLDKSLFGKKRKKYEAIYDPGSANPMELPGVCKHLMKMIRVLQESNIVG